MRQLDLRFVPIGIAVWLAFLILIRLIGPTVFTIGSPLLPIFYVLAIPITIVTIYLLSAVTRVPIQDMPMPVFVMTFTALLLDGIAVGFTSMYGETHDQIRAGAGFLLWGGGMGLVCTLLLAERARAAQRQK
ncbi:MAG: hypothetical protein SF123_04580 [Chloroflexota bacterium]|nr:hypothetical protein [Chloroflexota bacterium]